ncbi:MAG: Fis family transcriptional regulator, partial [Desulfobacterales bacterium]|nr:Fis family transcriptional regulator [Desulfobacterales bacterium]
YITLKKIDLSEVFSCEGFGEKEVLKAESGAINLSERVLAFEKGLIQKALEKTHWQKGRTAELLGIHRKTLFTKMRKHGLK